MDTEECMRRLSFSGAWILLFVSSVASAAEIVGIGEGAWLLRGTFAPGSQPDGNSVILDTRDGFVVIDTGRHASHTQTLIDFAASHDRPIVAVINTHWHLDHVGGNLMIRDRYPAVRVYASGAIDDAVTGFLTTYANQLREVIPSTADAAQRAAYETELRLIEQSDRLRPTDVVRGAGKLIIGGRVLDVFRPPHAATAGDTWIIDDRARLLIAGDLITLPVPFLDTASPAGWSHALERVAGLAGGRRVVPGHGRVMDREDVVRYARAFDGLRACIASEAEGSACATSYLDDIGGLVPVSEHAFARSLLMYYVESGRR